MCLRFGSDPQRDFLGTATPRRAADTVTKSHRVLLKKAGNADHLQGGTQVNCSYVMTEACATVKE
jgi:hypothetical protein